MKILLYIGFICLTIGLSRSAKVIILTQYHGSHIIYHAKIARLLADEGHAVDIILPTSYRIPDSLKGGSNVRILAHRKDSQSSDCHIEKRSKMLLDYAMSESTLEKLVIYTKLRMHTDPILDQTCKTLLNDAKLRKQLNTTDYDVAVVDLLSLECYWSLMDGWNIPVVTVGIYAYEWALRVPALPSFVPILYSSLDDRMTFWERVKNSVLYITSHLLLTSILSRPPYSIPSISRSSLYFALDDVGMDYPRPTMPNLIFIGDAIPDPGKPLPADIAAFVDGAEHGVVLVSFGSYLRRLPTGLTDKFCDAFKRIPQKVIWKQDNATLSGVDPDKVLMRSWLPQNDLLSHPNVKLLVSHCGRNSILEAIYHATPIIGFPTDVDQPYNARMVASRRFGSRMDFGDFSATELATKIIETIADETVSYNIRRASFLLRNKPDTPSKRMSYWVEHLATYGDDHLRSGAMHLNILQFYCIDVILVFIMVIGLMLIITYYTLKSIYRCFRGTSGLKRKSD
ncbi:hypothetical protein LSH36_1055g00085 [Paralvinella palmiformis]|uniref:UDP-glucuronosyltransferase n=1 Tax=Paralvinella palmiformis TaxID=53620 RepID=A0AAD9MQH6_9ANNE|nr:hypothetical protein LSH36_1055g00085 [Paralvinella palmiformis]